ncbi:MAG: tyrosine-type recombinase/integrase [Deltaproteobacteria bacterium]|nr:tyrosine-type recombinase/integrase [Deltaproteobacteria bacterium]
MLKGDYQKEPAISLFYEEFVEKFFRDYANTLPEKTLSGYENALKKLLSKYVGRLRLNKIKRYDIERCLAEYNVMDTTKNRFLCYLRVFFRKAVEWEYLAKSPMDGIKSFREEKGRGSHALTSSQLSSIWNGLNRWQASVLRVFLYTGMRHGELSNFKFKDINWDADMLAIVCDKTRKTKNRKTRYIPMSQDLKEELLFLRERLPDYRGGHGREVSRLPHQREYVFCHQNGDKIKSFKGTIHFIMRKHGITDVTTHGLRKTFCSQLGRAGVHPKVAQRLMGHSDIRLTMDVYTEIGDEDVKNAIKSLPSVAEMRRSQLTVVDGQKECGGKTGWGK